MIQIHINPARIERILLIAESEIEEDFDFAAWQAIRSDIDRINRKLARLAKKTLRWAEREGA